LQPYVIRQGDHLALLAYKFGFDADTVWNDPKNAQLRQAGQLSQDPNILTPTDMLYIPDPAPPAMKSLEPGTTNTFVADPPTVSFTVQFMGDSFASQSYTLQELPELTNLTTDGDGIATFNVPVTQTVLTVVFTASGAKYVVKIGHLDPIGTLSGIFQRLRSLGFIDSGANFDSTDLQFMRAALRAFKAAQPGGTPAPGDSSPASTPPPSSDSNPPPSSEPSSSSPSSPSSSSDDGPPPSSSSPESDASPSSDGVPPPSSAPSSQEDNAGLSDDGTLDDATTKLLFDAHGS
jgi:hypothetical protein